ncbi:MAG: hypothetical protein RLY78_720, partial [Pseudomonadota bacterium]
MTDAALPSARPPLPADPSWPAPRPLRFVFRDR